MKKERNSSMKTVCALFGILLTGVVWPLETAQSAEPFGRWTARLDLGGTIPEEADLTELAGPVSGEKFKLDPGFQLDMSAGYRLTPWLEVGPELGFTLNSVDSIGRWSYHDTFLGQILMMANVRLEYPVKSRVAPFVGAGIGGVASFLTFGEHYGHHSGYYYDYYEPDGTGSDFSLAFQLFGGVRYRVAGKWNLGLEYRYLVTDPQRWNVEWWNGADFTVGIDNLRMHSICLVFSGEF
jgi:opacity protein-like surface antigen